MIGASRAARQSTRWDRRTIRPAALAPSVAGGCSSGRTKPVDFSETARNYRPNDYDRVRQNWTRHAYVARDFGTVIEAWAIYKSWDFRQAYIEQYADVFGHNDGERLELRASQLQASQASYEFHVAAQCTNYKWNNLEDRDSTWKVSLVDGTGAELRHESIEYKRLPGDYVMRFFPDATDFTRTYIIKFPRDGKSRPGEPPPRPFGGPETGRIILRIAGPLGRADLIWESR